MRTKKTIINLKLRAGRRTAEVVALAKILFGLFLGMALLSGAQIALCKHESGGKKSWLECVAPELAKRAKAK